MNSSDEKPEPLKLLSLDGGGVRGLSQLFILKELMDRIKTAENIKRDCNGLPSLHAPPKPCDYFDMICGTSTGGMLGRLRMPVDVAIHHYHRLAVEAFSKPKSIRWKEGRYSTTRLESVIKSVVQEVTGNAEEPLMDALQPYSCKTFVCAQYVLDTNDNIPVLFRTYRLQGTSTNCKIWEAARATSATPTLFKHIEIGRRQSYIDGGPGLNNPSEALLGEAKEVFARHPIGCLVSIGTGQASVRESGKPGLFQRVALTHVVNLLTLLAIDSGGTHQDMLGHFQQPDVYFRLNVHRGLEDIGHAQWEDINVVATHTKAYVNEPTVSGELDVLVKAMTAPAAQMEQEAYLQGV